jgi:uncharacterized CHY-type Zn-finger protein
VCVTLSINFVHLLFLTDRFSVATPGMAKMALPNIAYKIDSCSHLSLKLIELNLECTILSMPAFRQQGISQLWIKLLLSYQEATRLKIVIGAIDSHTRCKHYHSERDVIAIKFKCCDTYYGCYYCHEELAGHQPIIWPKQEWQTKAVLCGNCSAEIAIEDYLSSNYQCPECQTDFNPGCRNHYHLYFEWAQQ